MGRGEVHLKVESTCVRQNNGWGGYKSLKCYFGLIVILADCMNPGLMFFKNCHSCIKLRYKLFGENANYATVYLLQ